MAATDVKIWLGSDLRMYFFFGATLTLPASGTEIEKSIGVRMGQIRSYHIARAP